MLDNKTATPRSVADQEILMKDLIKSESVKVFKEDDNEEVARIRDTDELSKA